MQNWNEENQINEIVAEILNIAAIGAIAVEGSGVSVVAWPIANQIGWSAVSQMSTRYVLGFINDTNLNVGIAASALASILEKNILLPAGQYVVSSVASMFEGTSTITISDQTDNILVYADSIRDNTITHS